jgi:hypothetical protein
MESLDECLNIRTAISGEQGLLVAQTICKKGDVFAAMSDYPAAMYNYRKGLDIMQVEPNRNRRSIGSTFQGAFWIADGVFFTAKDIFQQQTVPHTRVLSHFFSFFHSSFLI